MDFGRAFNHLCHILALSRSGKPREVLDSLLISAAVLDGGPFEARQDLAGAVKAFLGLTVPEVEFNQSVKRLVSAGKLSFTDSEGIEVAAAAVDSVQERTEEAEALEQTVREEWLAEVDAICADLDSEVLWRSLRAYMVKAFRRHGIIAAELLSPEVGLSDEEAAPVDKILHDVLVEEGSVDTCAEEAIRLFFATRTPARTEYLVQHADATFTFFALSLDESLGSYVRPVMPELLAFLDTNVVLGMLEMHLNPQNDAATDLIEFVQTNSFPYKFYYHSETLKEIERTVDGISRRLRSQKWRPELSAAVVRPPVADSISGIELRYHEINAEQPLEVDIFLSRFEHLEEILSGQGIKLYREPGLGEPYTVVQKGLAISEYEAYVEERRPGNPKLYSTLDHDMAVWLSVESKRSDGARNVLDSGAVFVTHDFLLHRFARREARKKNQPSSVVLAEQMLQVLRAFGRSSEDLDRRFAESFALPEFRSAHSDYRRATQTAMSYLNTFADLTPEVAYRVLASEALMTDLDEADSAAEELELVENLLVADNAVLVEEREAILADRDRVLREREAARAEAAAADAAAEEEARVRRAVEAALAEERAERAAVEAVRDDYAGLASEARRQQVAAKADARKQIGDLNARLRIVVGSATSILLLLLLALVPAATSWRWLEDHENRATIYLLSAVMCIGIGVAVAWKRRRVEVVLGVILAALISLATAL